MKASTELVPEDEKNIDILKRVFGEESAAHVEALEADPLSDGLLRWYMVEIQSGTVTSSKLTLFDSVAYPELRKFKIYQITASKGATRPSLRIYFAAESGA
jgi:hypothetical protein